MPRQVIGNGVTDHYIVPGTGNDILNQRVTRDHEVAGQAVHVRDSFRAKVNTLVIRIRAQVQRVVAAVVMDR